MKNLTHHWYDGGDDARDHAIGWMIEHAPDGRLTFASSKRCEVVIGDTVHVFHRNDGPTTTKEVR